MTDVTDSGLMLRLAAGDDLALNALMDRWSQRVSSFLYRMTGNRDSAIDLAQETFVKLYQARERYKPSGVFSTYLFAIASNLARNHSRWRARHPMVSLDAAADDESFVRSEPIDPTQDPGEAAQASEKFQAIERALFSLAPDLREAMVLFLYEGMGYSEIASMVGCSSKAVETRIYRARQVLKIQLKELSA